MVGGPLSGITEICRVLEFWLIGSTQQVQVALDLQLKWFARICRATILEWSPLALNGIKKKKCMQFFFIPYRKYCSTFFLFCLPVHWPASSMMTWEKWFFGNFIYSRLPNVLQVLTRIRYVLRTLESHWYLMPVLLECCSSARDPGAAMLAVKQNRWISSGIVSRSKLFMLTMRTNSPHSRCLLSINNLVIKFAELFDGVATMIFASFLRTSWRMVSIKVDVFPVPV